MRSKRVILKFYPKNYRSKSLAGIVGLFLFLWCFFGCQTQEQATKWLEITDQVNGNLSYIEHIRVLKLWGSHYEMGYAHGYLLGPESMEMAELEMSQSGLLDFYQNVVLPNIHLYHVPESYMDEIRGFFAGMTARAEGRRVYSEMLKREITLNDVIASNYVSAMITEINCSSFSAWGNMTGDGSVLVGYNHDGPDNNLYTGRWLIIARVPADQTGAIPSVCIGRAGNFNVHTAMNAYGVTLSCQGINSPNANEPTSTEGFTSEGIVFRKLIETVDNLNQIGDIKRVLNKFYTHEAETLLMAWPLQNGDIPTTAVEIDGDLTVTSGYTLRGPGSNEEYLIQTNQFWVRFEPGQCQRYDQCKDYFESLCAGKKQPLTLNSAWELLGKELHPLPGNLVTQHAVVFEPKKKLMHIAVFEPGKSTHTKERLTVNVEELVKIP